MPIGTQISNTKFQQYANYYTFAARSGVRSSQAVFSAIAHALLVDITTFDRFDEVLNAKNSLLLNLRSSYEEIFTNAFALDPMRASFIALSEHIVAWTGGTVDEYLTAQGLKVSPTYASISLIAAGEAISPNNIQEV